MSAVLKSYLTACPAEPAKCEFAKATVTYLGKVVGQGQGLPIQAKVIAIKTIQWTPPRRSSCFFGFGGILPDFLTFFSLLLLVL